MFRECCISCYCCFIFDFITITLYFLLLLFYFWFYYYYVVFLVIVVLFLIILLWRPSWSRYYGIGIYICLSQQVPITILLLSVKMCIWYCSSLLFTCIYLPTKQMILPQKHYCCFKGKTSFIYSKCFLVCVLNLHKWKEKHLR